MIKKILNHFRPIFYIQVWEKRIRVTNVKTREVINEIPQLLIEKVSNQVLAYGTKAIISDNQSELINPFSHPRTLIADSMYAEQLLALIIKQLAANRWIKFSPIAIIQPMEKLDGGLTAVEIKAFKTLLLAAGARQATVYVGKELNLDNFTFRSVQDISSIDA